MSAGFFPLPIFPPGGLRESVVTTVWIGVLVAAFFNVRFGWTFSGIVVPGYLVPLLINKPLAAAVVLSEGVLTYLLVWLFSTVGSRLGWWADIFGRDRFFALLLASVLVRLGLDGWLLPEVGDYLVRELNFRLDYRNDLHSFGTVVVALIANCFWKSGIWRGWFPFAVNLFVTYLLTRYVLIEYTNFNIGSLLYLYEDIAVSFYASPKAYIILLVTAFIASRMNLRYGWDFNGILLPALLALQWYQPSKIITTLVEALLVVVLVRCFRKLPIVRNWVFEGAHKVVLFFNASFCYKLALGYYAAWYAPLVRVTDFYGFGYLLPCLLAIKISDREIPVRLAVTTLFTSFVGVVVATILGYTLTLVPNPFLLNSVRFNQATIAPLETISGSVFDFSQGAKLRAFAKSIPNSVPRPRPVQVELFTAGLKTLRSYLANQENDQLLKDARSYLRSVDYAVQRIGSKYLVLTEVGQNRGWGSFVIRLTEADAAGLAIEVPEPVKEWNTIESGAILFDQLNAQYLLLGGASLTVNPDHSANVLLQRDSFFQIFHRVLVRDNAVQLRGYTQSVVNQMYSSLNQFERNQNNEFKSTIWVPRSLPALLNLDRLKQLIGSYEVLWSKDPSTNILRDEASAKFATIWLNRRDRRELLFKPLWQLDLVEQERHEIAIDGYLQEWLLGGKREIAPRGSNQYIKPSERELLFLEQEVLKPLLQVVRHGFKGNALTEEGRRDLSAIGIAANILHMQVRWYRHLQSDNNYLILSDKAVQGRRYAGTYVFRVFPKEPFIIQVPRPLFENNSLEVAVVLFEQTGAELLAIAGAHRFANTDGSADILRPENKENVFNLVSQVALRESPNHPQLVLHSRAFGYHERRATSQEVVISADTGILINKGVSTLQKSISSYLKRQGLSFEYATGSSGTAGLGVSGLLTARYLEQLRNKEFLALWFSPHLRAKFRQQDHHSRQLNHFQTLGIVTLEKSLYEFLTGYADKSERVALDIEDRELLHHYLVTQDIVALQELILRRGDLRLLRLLDRDSRRAFLVIGSESSDSFPLVLNLNPTQIGGRMTLQSKAAMDQNQISEYVISGNAWLELEVLP